VNGVVRLFETGNCLRSNMTFRRRFKRFIITCLLGGLLGLVSFGAGSLIYQYSRSEIRRLWTPSKFDISGDLLKRDSAYFQVNFTPKATERHFLDLCASLIDQKKLNKAQTSTESPIDWQVLLNGQMAQVEAVASRNWGLSSADGSCMRLGWFRGIAGQEYQVKLKKDSVDPILLSSKLHLAVRPDVMASKGLVTNYQLAGVFFQLFGMIIFGVAVLKGIFKLVKPEKAPKSNNSDAAG
jgi:hypothetical protein